MRPRELRDAGENIQFPKFSSALAMTLEIGNFAEDVVANEMPVARATAACLQ